MFRRCVSLLVIAGFLASQLAAIPHAHGNASAEEQREHDAKPHCHFGHTHHDHGHSHSGHNHPHELPGQDQEEGSRPLSGGTDTELLETGLLATDHDANAIFLPGRAWTASTTSQKDHAQSVWQISALTANPVNLGNVPSFAKSAPRWHPPDEVLDASGSYLILRNLRI